MPTSFTNTFFLLLLALPTAAGAASAMKPIYVKPMAASKDIGPEPSLETSLKLGSRCQRWSYTHNFFTPLFEVQTDGAIVFANGQRAYTRETLRTAGNRKSKANARFEAIDTNELNAEVTIRLLDLHGKNLFPSNLYWTMSKRGEFSSVNEKVWGMSAIFGGDFDSVFCFPSSYPDPKSLTDHEVKQIVLARVENLELAKLLAAKAERISIHYGLASFSGKITASFSDDCRLWEWTIDVFTGKITKSSGPKPNCDGY